MKFCFLPAVLILHPGSFVVAADDSPSLPTAEEIVARMGSRDLQRQVSIVTAPHSKKAGTPDGGKTVEGMMHGRGDKHMTSCKRGKKCLPNVTK